MNETAENDPIKSETLRITRRQKTAVYDDVTNENKITEPTTSRYATRISENAQCKKT